MSGKSGSIFGGIFGVISYIVITLVGILPFYAAFVDFKRDNLFLAAVDIVTVIVGFIRGIMFIFGWL